MAASSPFGGLVYLNVGAKPPQPALTVKRRARREAPVDPRTFNNSVAKRVWDRQHAKESYDLTGLRLIPWNVIHRKLLELNPRMFFVEIGDGRIGIGVEHPSPSAIADYESLTHSERQEFDQYREIKGPRVLLICASKNAVEPYTEMVSAGGVHISEEKQEDGTTAMAAHREPERVICRALRTIVQACVEAGAFTWEAAEAKFGMPLHAVSTNVRYMPFSPTDFHNRTSNIILGGA